MQQNGTNALCSLSDDILLRIMRSADPVSLFCLRRTSRTFMRLFSDREFRSLHDDSNKNWPVTGRPHPGTP
ncbi:hypothetical protein B0T14DRAFT_508810 [Immersiella caudata]|uniref:F-box domain-containing protein n=1 Tax=Immersiella caudata TaxID=314043 RepID=A0AA39X2B2_9PEZI|nr:hypothetical protein B0T14DRAFT_508810 [Immersiella caudata]